MLNIIKRTNKSKSDISKEYAQVNSNPVTKAIVQTLVMLIDLVIIFLLLWNTFAYFIPSGSWFSIVDGESMSPTMSDGQIIFTDIDSISRGDIVTAHVPQHVLQDHPESKKMVVVKRVVGMPGDRIVIDEAGVHINGELFFESYLTEEAKQYTYAENQYNSLLLEDNEYFLMGDNRKVSYDSRDYGVVRADELIYKQSSKPTVNFYLKLALVILIFVLDIFLYALIEFVLTECAYWLIYKRKSKAQASEKEKAICHTTTETAIWKGDKE